MGEGGGGANSAAKLEIVCVIRARIRSSTRVGFLASSKVRQLTLA